MAPCWNLALKLKLLTGIGREDGLRLELGVASMLWSVERQQGRKQSWPNSRYYPEICLEVLRKTAKTLMIASLRTEI
jgi:hypothetical protein